MQAWQGNGFSWARSSLRRPSKEHHFCLLKKPISVPGECWWEGLGTLQASSALCKSKIFFRKCRVPVGRLMLVNEQDLIAGIALATFSQFRNPFLARQCKVCTKGVSAAQSPLWNCIPSPEPSCWAVITCAVLLDFSKVSLYPY